MRGGRQGLYRQAALQQLSTPEQLDQLMKVTRPRSWLGLLGVWLVIMTTIVWGIFGSLPTVVKGQGILIREGSIQTVDSPASGELDELYFNVGDTIAQDQVVARVFQQGDASRDGGTSRAVLVKSTHGGRVIETRVRRGNVIQAGQTLLSLEIAGRSLEGILYLTPFEGKKVRPGMDVQLAPAPVKREEFGLMLGRVYSVGQLPASVEGMKRVLGNEDLARDLSKEGAPIEIRVELLRTSSTFSGYQWTSTLPSTVSSVPGMALGALGVAASGTASGYRGLIGVLPDGWSTSLPPELSTSGIDAMSAVPSQHAGPQILIGSGTPTMADVIVEEQAPIFLILAKLNR